VCILKQHISADDCERNGRDTTVNTSDMKVWKIQSSKDRRITDCTATRLASVIWNSCQDHLEIKIPPGVCTVCVVTIIRRPQGRREGLCPLIPAAVY